VRHRVRDKLRHLHPGLLSFGLDRVKEPAGSQPRRFVSEPSGDAPLWIHDAPPVSALQAFLLQSKSSWIRSRASYFLNALL
jgi:hypothetical protein